MTDNLRDALEKYFSNGGPDTPIRTTWHDGEEYWEAPASDIRELIAAHPVEPATADEWEDELEPFIAEQMKNPAFKAAYEAEVARDSEPAPGVSDEAVQVATSAFYEHPASHGMNTKAQRRAIRAALEAAQPFMGAVPVDREALERAIDAAFEEMGSMFPDGPPMEALVGQIAGYVLALINGPECSCHITDRDERIWNRDCLKHPRP